MRDCLIVYILHRMACISGAEPIATEHLSPHYDYMHMIINLAFMVIDSIRYELKALKIESLWVPVCGF